MNFLEAHEYCVATIAEHGLGEKVEFTLSDANHVDLDMQGHFSRPHLCGDDDRPISPHSKPIIGIEINWVKLNGESWLRDVITHEIAHAQHYERCMERGDEFPVDDHGNEFYNLWQESLGRIIYPLTAATGPNARWIAYCPRPDCDYLSWTQTLNPRWDEKTEGWNMGSCSRCRRSSGNHHSVLRWVRSLYIEEKDITPEFRAMDVPSIVWRPCLSPALENSLPPLLTHSGIGVEQEYPGFTIDSWGMSGPDLLKKRLEEIRSN